jgi:hypothetical protein
VSWLGKIPNIKNQKGEKIKMKTWLSAAALSASSTVGRYQRRV